MPQIKFHFYPGTEIHLIVASTPWKYIFEALLDKFSQLPWTYPPYPRFYISKLWLWGPPVCSTLKWSIALAHVQSAIEHYRALQTGGPQNQSLLMLVSSWRFTTTYLLFVHPRASPPTVFGRPKHRRLPLADVELCRCPTDLVLVGMVPSISEGQREKAMPLPCRLCSVILMSAKQWCWSRDVTLILNCTADQMFQMLQSWLYRIQNMPYTEAILCS